MENETNGVFIPCCIPVVGDIMTFAEPGLLDEDDETYMVIGMRLDDDDDLIVRLEKKNKETFEAYACELNVMI